ncbi:MAG: hypothetical protein ACK4N6_00600, partial [Rhodocyclaceae bacterium]
MSEDVSQYKILFVGPVGAGKTTAVSSLSDKEALTTDVAVSDSTSVPMARLPLPIADDACEPATRVSEPAVILLS